MIPSRIQDLLLSKRADYSTETAVVERSGDAASSAEEILMGPVWGNFA